MVVCNLENVLCESSFHPPFHVFINPSMFHVVRGVQQKNQGRLLPSWGSYR